MIHGILCIQSTCSTVFFHNLSPSLLWSTSWPGSSTSYSTHFFTQSLSSLRSTCHTIATCSAVVLRLCPLIPVSLSTLYLELYLVTSHHTSIHPVHTSPYNINLTLYSVLWCSWLGDKQGTWPVKTEWWDTGVVTCLWQGSDLHMAQLMPLPLTVCCFSKIQIGFTFLVPPHLGSPKQRAVKRVLFLLLYSNSDIVAQLLRLKRLYRVYLQSNNTKENATSNDNLTSD